MKGQFSGGQPIKGPGFRLDLDVRRVWRCPHCGRVRKTPGRVTHMACSCGDGVWMQLIESRPSEPPSPPSGAADNGDRQSEETGQTPAEQLPAVNVLQSGESPETPH